MTLTPKRISELREMLAAVTEGHLSAEMDDSFPTKHTRDIYRIVGEEARKRRKEQNTTARPVYVATVYSGEYTKLFVSAVAALPALLDEVEQLQKLVRDTDECFDWLVRGSGECGCGECRQCFSNEVATKVTSYLAPRETL